jgi:hypothetical protein
MASIEEEKNSASFQKIIELHAQVGLKHFKKILRSYLVFHTLFAGLFFLEAVFLLSLYFFEKVSVIFALGIFAFVLTLFTYLVLIFYFQTKKPEQLRQLKDWYLSVCKKSLPQESLSETEFHLFLAQALHLFSSSFQPKELPVYLSSIPLPSFKRLMKC